MLSGWRHEFLLPPVVMTRARLSMPLSVNGAVSGNGSPRGRLRAQVSAWISCVSLPPHTPPGRVDAGTEMREQILANGCGQLGVPSCVNRNDVISHYDKCMQREKCDLATGMRASYA